MLNLPRNIYVLSLFMALSMSSVSLMLLVSGLLGTHLAPQKELATLPLALLVVGTACATIPASLLMQRIGRKAGLFCGASLSMACTLLAMWATIHANFTGLLVASFGIGINIAFAQTARFAILESTSDEKQQASGLTLALLAGLLSAFIGPQLGVLGKDLIESPHGYAGSFLLIFILQLFALLLLILFKNPKSKSDSEESTGRPLLEIIKQPIFIVATASGAVAYGVMSFIMTATPISMHHFDNHSLESTKWVLQSHMIAMFLPSIIIGFLLPRVNKLFLLLGGSAIYLIVSVIALGGHAFLHYWWALVLLGIGWNALYVTATAILPKSYNDNERFKVQACNDFLVFGFQALASFFAGFILFQVGWTGVIWISLLMIAPLCVFLLFVFFNAKKMNINL